MNDQDSSEDTETACPINAPQIPFPPAIYPALAIGAGYFLQQFVHLQPPAHRSFMSIGWVSFVISILLIIWSLATLKNAGTTALPHRATKQLVTTGPYRFSRNPVYLAFLLLTLASALTAGNLWILLSLPVVMALLTAHAVGPEEKHLQEVFDKHYDDYCRTVRRWL